MIKSVNVIWFIILIALSFYVHAAESLASACHITRDGKPQSTIIIAQRPTRAVSFAAMELQQHILKISGATLPIVNDSVSVKGPRILVGESAATRALKLDGDFKSQEYMIKFLPDTLVLMGRDALAGDQGSTATPERVAGRFGNALKFDGIKTVINIDDCPFSDPSGSLECWVWMPAAVQERAGTILRLDGRDPWSYHIIQRDAGTSVISYTTYDGKECGRVYSGVLSEGWHHILATYDAAAGKSALFVDGVAVGSSKYVQTTCKGATLRIGGLKVDEHSPLGNPFAGMIDEVRLSSVVRMAKDCPLDKPCKSDAETTALFHFDKMENMFLDECNRTHVNVTPPGFFEDRGSLDAVYDFLEHYCGVRWYAPGDIGLVCPSNPTLVVQGANIRRSPAMDYRWIVPTPLYVPAPPKQMPVRAVNLWKLRMRLGGKATAVNHSFYGYYDRFLKEHSDWFAQGYPGKPPQMCYTNPDFIKQVIADARDYFDGKGAQPGAAAMGDVFGLVPMDNAQYCKCERCQSMLNDAARDNPQFTSGYASDYIQGFVNNVAREVRRTHPDKWIGTLGYWQYAYYPDDVRLEPNVMVQLCLHPRNWWCPSMEANDRKVLADWRRQDPDRPIYLWLYYCFPALNAQSEKYNGFPGFFAHSVVKQMKLYHDAKVRGIFLEHSSEFGATWLMDQLEFYVTFKLADNPELDGDQLIEDFFTSYYGSAAVPMKKLYCGIEDAYSQAKSYPDEIQKSPAHHHQNEKLAWGALGTEERMAEFAALMGKAQASAVTAVEKKRVALFKEGIWLYMLEGRKRHNR